MTHPATRAQEIADDVAGVGPATRQSRWGPDTRLALAQVYATLAVAEALGDIGTGLEHLKTIGVELGAVSIAISEARS